MKTNKTFVQYNSEVGIQTIGSGVPEIRVYFSPENLVRTNYKYSTLNEGEETTNEKIDKHLKRYDKVWKALS